MSLDIKAKGLLVKMMNASAVSNKFKIDLVDNFLIDSTNASATTGRGNSVANIAFKMSYDSLINALENNDSNNSELENIIIHANGCMNAMKNALFP